MLTTQLGMENTVACHLDRLTPGAGPLFITGIRTECPNDSITIATLNRYFRRQLLQIPAVQSRVALECLCTSQDFGAWFSNFKQNVAPLLQQSNLLEYCHGHTSHVA